MGLNIEKIRQLREKANLSQEEAAKLAGMRGRVRWNEIERGVRKNITLATLEGIARALKVEPGELLKK